MGAGSLGFLGMLPRLSAEELEPGKGFVSLRPEIEPLVRLLEETSRERLLEEVAQRIKTGTTYRELLAAVMLAGVRNIQPRPVGFKFHAVLVVNSAHLASLNAPDEDRWLPLFWALDRFKGSQAQDVREGDWTMPAVDEKALPAAGKAAAAFCEAMDAWDEARTDVAIAALSVSARAVRRLEDKAERARIGRYYATESMLAIDPVTGRYDGDATPSFGRETLRDFYRRVLAEGLAGHELGDAALFERSKR